MTLVSVAVAPNRSTAWMRQKAGRLLKQQARRVIGLALNERMLSLIPPKTAQPFWSEATEKKIVGGEDVGYFSGRALAQARGRRFASCRLF
jgi:hypothetical protein